MLSHARTLFSLACFGWATLTLSAQNEPTTQELSLAFNQLLLADTLSEDVLQTGREAGLSELNLFEARALRTLRGTDSFEGVVEAYDAIGAEVSLAESMIFGSEMEWKGMGHLLRARQAQLDDDRSAFEAHAKEAFWLAPDYAPVLMQWIGDFRRSEAMADLVLPMGTELLNVDGETVTLAQLAEGQKALLLDFWASWCPPCIEKLPELQAKASDLATKNVVVVSINVESLDDALKVYSQQTIEHPWLVEPAAQPFVRALQVDSLPRSVLVTPEGRILFNGFHVDAALTQALEDLGVAQAPTPVAESAAASTGG